MSGVASVDGVAEDAVASGNSVEIGGVTSTVLEHPIIKQNMNSRRFFSGCIVCSLSLVRVFCGC